MERLSYLTHTEVRGHSDTEQLLHRITALIERPEGSEQV